MGPSWIMEEGGTKDPAAFMNCSHHHQLEPHSPLPHFINEEWGSADRMVLKVIVPKL